MIKSALLITYPIKHIADEARSLAESAGYSVIRTVTQRHLTDQNLVSVRERQMMLVNSSSHWILSL